LTKFTAERGNVSSRRAAFPIAENLPTETLRKHEDSGKPTKKWQLVTYVIVIVGIHEDCNKVPGNLASFPGLHPGFSQCRPHVGPGPLALTVAARNPLKN
jgi:hypothetical protein